MNADELVQYFSWAVYALIFVVVAIRAIRRPLRFNIDIALFFTVSTVIIALALVGRLDLVDENSQGVVTLIESAMLLSLAYLLFRLVDDFSDVPRWQMRLSEALLIIFIAGNIVLPRPLPTLFPLSEIIYLVGLLIITVLAFIREARRSSGVTQRRLRAVAVGSIFLCIDFGTLGLGLLMPALAGLWQSLSDLAGLASGIAYYLGFAPPNLLRRAWQEPELRSFLGRAASLPRLPDTQSIVAELERGAATSVGAPHASIGLWDEDSHMLHFLVNGKSLDFDPDSTTSRTTITARSFVGQQPMYSDNLQRDNPVSGEEARAQGVTALLAAPITAGERRLGILTVYAPRAPIFADEDLDLVKLLADQAAVILESRALIDEAARVRAREEVARLKEDFLSAAAHDLKTPLTTLVAQTQLLERRARRMPDAPADLASLQKLEREAQRLKTLVLELLDAARTEQGRLVGDLEDTDLVSAAQETCSRHYSERHPCLLEADGAVMGTYDRIRIDQLIENLVENAVKYSPEGGAVRIKVWRQEDWNYLTVTDNGIGIPVSDLPHVFDRFHRGTNVDDRRFAGMGLGLFICRGIVEQHGGRIWVTSTPGAGTTFHVMLPAVASAVNEASSALAAGT